MVLVQVEIVGLISCDLGSSLYNLGISKVSISEIRGLNWSSNEALSMPIRQRCTIASIAFDTVGKPQTRKEK